MATTTGPEATTDSGLFARNATGLVRNVTPLSAYVLNFVPGTPVQALGYGLFFAFAVFPGGSFLMAGLLAIPLALAFAYTFGLLTSMIPRTGGDYMLVSRVLHPLPGLVSSFCMTVANMLSVAFFGVAIVILGVSPGLIALGLIADSPTLIDWGNTIAASKWWTFGIGTLLVVLGGAILAVNWKWTARLQLGLLCFVLLGLVAAVLVALFTSNDAFIENFNAFAQPYTQQPDSYQQTIAAAQAAGVDTDSSFSLANTIPIIGIFASFGIYSWFATFVGGELRQARSTKTANMMALAGVAGIVIVLVASAILLRTFSTDFMTAANAAGLPEQIATAPTYFFLLAASAGNTALAAFLILSYLAFWPLIVSVAFLQPTRMVFAYAFDGILPKSATRLSRAGTPLLALLVTVLVTIGMLVWAVNSASIFRAIVYAVLIQLIAMGLVGVAAVVVPWRRPELYRAGSSQRTVAGIPVVTIAGVGSILSAAFIWFLYLHYAGFGLSDKGEFFTWIGGVIAAAILFYFGARAVRRSQGVDLARVYAEIPPE